MPVATIAPQTLPHDVHPYAHPRRVRFDTTRTPSPRRPARSPTRAAAPLSADIRSLARAARWFDIAARQPQTPEAAIELAAAAAALTHTLNILAARFPSPLEAWPPGFLDSAVDLAFTQGIPALLAALATRPTCPVQRYTLSALAQACPPHGNARATGDITTHAQALLSVSGPISSWCSTALNTRAPRALYVLQNFSHRRDAAAAALAPGTTLNPHPLRPGDLYAACTERCAPAKEVLGRAARAIAESANAADLQGFVRAAACSGADEVCPACARGLRAALVLLWSSGPGALPEWDD